MMRAACGSERGGLIHVWWQKLCTVARVCGGNAGADRAGNGRDRLGCGGKGRARPGRSGQPWAGLADVSERSSEDAEEFSDEQFVDDTFLWDAIADGDADTAEFERLERSAQRSGPSRGV